MAAIPVQSARVGSGFGPRPCHTRGNTGCVHAGWDFVGAAGDPVVAADEGVVERVFHNEDLHSQMRGYGNVVVIRHPDNTWTSYNHMQELLVGPGDHVEAGTLIGRIGNTTNRKFFIAPHLHFEARGPKPGGRSPFPGAYGRFNIDPALWFARRGLVAASIPGTLTRGVAGLGEEDYVPDHQREPTFFEQYDRVIFGAALINLSLYMGTGELPIWRPFKGRKLRRFR